MASRTDAQPTDVIEPRSPSRGDYDSYLVRMWRTRSHTAWRTSAQSTATGQVHHFASVEALCTFLTEQMEDVTEGAAGAHPVQGAGDRLN